MAYLEIPWDVQFLDDTATPIAGAAPTITIRNGAGTAIITSAVMTEYTSETGAYYHYDYVPLVAGTYTGVASTADPDATQPIVLIGNATAEQDSAGTAEEIADAVWEHSPRSLTTSGNVVYLPSQNPTTGFEEKIIGNDYTSGLDDRPLLFSSENYPILTGGSILYKQRHQSYADQTFSKAGSVVGPQEAMVELIHTETALFLAGLVDVEVIATLSDGTVVTIAEPTYLWKAPVVGGV